MKEIHFLENTFGGRWFGIRFSNDGNGEGQFPKHPISFCRAVSDSRMGPVVLTKEYTDCLGGNRSLGWLENDKMLAEEMAGKAGIDADITKRIVADTPKLRQGFDRVIIGAQFSPDIFISYAHPEVAMKVIRMWQRMTGTTPSLSPSAFLSVCGTVAANVYSTDTISISFGCPESRKTSRIGKDRLVIGISQKQVKKIMAEDG
jgi:uncharacterized protein (DUF169 family)